MDILDFLMMAAVISIILLYYRKKDQKMFTGKLITKKVKCIEKKYYKTIRGYNCYVFFQYEDLIFFIDHPFAYENIKIDDSVEVTFRKKYVHLDKKNPKNNQYKLVPSILNIKDYEIEFFEGHTLKKEDFEKYYKEDKKEKEERKFK